VVLIHYSGLLGAFILSIRQYREKSPQLITEEVMKIKNNNLKSCILAIARLRKKKQKTFSCQRAHIYWVLAMCDNLHWVILICCIL
jgi:hypothetical protein